MDENHGKPERLLYRLSEAAQILGLGRSTLYEMAACGTIPTVRIGRAVRIPRRALEAWIERLEREQG